MKNNSQKVSFRIALIALLILLVFVVVLLFQTISSSSVTNKYSPIEKPVSYIEYQDGFVIKSDFSQEITGFGSFSNNANEQYTGEWSLGVPNGTGKYDYSNGVVYIGEFKDGLRNGNGTAVFIDGSTYEGSWEKDLIMGEGKLEYPDGTSYTGTFENGAFKSGSIAVYSVDRLVRYELNFKNGKYSGTGRILYSNGSFYSGDLLLEGNSDYVLSIEKNQYYNTKVKVIREGYGVYTWNSTSNMYYQGLWHDNKMSGMGELHFSDTEWISGFFEDNKPVKVTYYTTSNKSQNGIELIWDDK